MPPPVNVLEAPFRPTQLVSQDLPIAENIAGGDWHTSPLFRRSCFRTVEPFSRNLFVRFHAFQHLFLFVAAAVSAVAAFCLWMVLQLIPFMRVLVFPFAGLIGLAWFFLWLLLVIKAYHHEMFKLPLLGDLAESKPA